MGYLDLAERSWSSAGVHLEQALAIHRRLGCPVIEISDLSIEETAARVIRLIEQRRAEAGATLTTA